MLVWPLPPLRVDECRGMVVAEYETIADGAVGNHNQPGRRATKTDHAMIIRQPVYPMFPASVF